MKNITFKILFTFILLHSTEFAQDIVQADSVDAVNDSVYVMQKSPWGAVLRSAILPGWGQYYNESYLKIPIFLGTSITLASIYVYYNNKAIDARNRYSKSVSIGDPVEFYRQERDFYKDNRDLFAIYFFLSYMLNLVDAYVDAHLFDFDVSENTYLHHPEIGVRIKF